MVTAGTLNPPVLSLGPKRRTRNETGRRFKRDCTPVPMVRAGRGKTLCLSGHQPPPRLGVHVLSSPHLLPLPFIPSGLVDHREVYQSLAGGGELLLFKPRWAGGSQSSQLAPLRPLTLDPMFLEAPTLTAQTKHIKLFFDICILCILLCILLGGSTTQSPSRTTCNLQHPFCDQPCQVPGNPPISCPVSSKPKTATVGIPGSCLGLCGCQSQRQSRCTGGWGGCEPQEPFGEQKGLPKAEINLSSPSSQKA